MKRYISIILTCILAAGLALSLSGCTIDITKNNGETIHFDLGDLDNLETIDWDQILGATEEIGSDNPEFQEYIEGLLGDSLGGENAGEQEQAGGFLDNFTDSANDVEIPSTPEELGEQLGMTPEEMQEAVQSITEQLQEMLGQSLGGESPDTIAIPSADTEESAGGFETEEETTQHVFDSQEF